MATNQGIRLQDYKVKQLYEFLRYEKGHPTRNIDSLRRDVGAFLKEYESRESMIPPFSKGNSESRLCAVHFLKEDERGERLFPENSEEVLTWSNDKETYILRTAIWYCTDHYSLLEAFSCLFRLGALSNCASQKGPWYEKTKERKLQAQNSDVTKTPSQQDRKRARSSEEDEDFIQDEEPVEESVEKLVEKLVYDDLNIQQLNKDYSLKTWNAPPERFNRSAALHHVQTINPRNDRPKTNLTNNWLSEVDADFPSAADAFVQRYMHEYEIYSPDDLQRVMPGIVSMLVAGTELEGTRQDDKLEKRVEDRTKYWTDNFKARHFIENSGPDHKLKMTIRFRHLWDSRHEHWNAEQQQQTQQSSDAPRHRKKPKITTPKRVAKDPIAFPNLARPQKQALDRSPTPNSVYKVNGAITDREERVQIDGRLSTPKSASVETNTTPSVGLNPVSVARNSLETMAQTQQHDDTTHTALMDEFIVVEPSRQVRLLVTSQNQNMPLDRDKSSHPDSMVDSTAAKTHASAVTSSHHHLDNFMAAFERQAQLSSPPSPPASAPSNCSLSSRWGSYEEQGSVAFLPPQYARFGPSPETTLSPRREREITSQEPKQQSATMMAQILEQVFTEGAVEDRIPLHMGTTHPSASTQATTGTTEHDGTRVTPELSNITNLYQGNSQPGRCSSAARQTMHTLPSGGLPLSPPSPIARDPSQPGGPCQPARRRTPHRSASPPPPSQILPPTPAPESNHPRNAYHSVYAAQTDAPHGVSRPRPSENISLTDIIFEVQMRTPSQARSDPARKTLFLACSELPKEEWKALPATALRCYHLSWDLFRKRLNKAFNIVYNADNDAIDCKTQPTKLDSRQEFLVIKDQLTFLNAVGTMHDAALSSSSKIPFVIYLWLSPERLKSGSRNSQSAIVTSSQIPTSASIGTLTSLDTSSPSPAMFLAPVPVDQDPRNPAQNLTPSNDPITPHSRTPSPIQLPGPEPRPYNYIPEPIPFSSEQRPSPTPPPTSLVRGAIPENRIAPSREPPVADNKGNEDGLQFIFETPQKRLGYDDQIPFQEIDDWSVADLFDHYSRKTGKSLAAITELKISTDFGNRQDFVAERDGEKQKWEIIKYRIKRRFMREKEKKPDTPTFDVLVEE